MLILGRTATPEPSRWQTTEQAILALPGEISRQRTHLGLTSSQTARHIGVTTNTLTRLEAGANVTQSTILAACRWLDAQGSP